MTDSRPYHAKALPLGTVLREWRLEGLLGTGGFGIVYRGTGVYFNETVAIKEYFPSAISDRVDGVTVAPTDSSSQELYQHGMQKFVEEAKILWNLSRPERHPNIVCVRSLFEIHGTAYMVMDFEQGVSLSQMLREGRSFDETSLMAIIRPIAEGLARAHAAGVYHRDIKPANILVSDDGRPVLIDFGSARFETGQVTSTKVTFYTPPYAALEQYVRTFPQGPWTDIYALGVTMYQCITGEKPAEVLERLHGGAGQPLAARTLPGYSQDFLAAVDAAMAIKPEERPQNLAAWVSMLDPNTMLSASFEATRTAVGVAGDVWQPEPLHTTHSGFYRTAETLAEAGAAAEESARKGKKKKGRYARRGGWRSISIGSIVFNLFLLGLAVFLSNSLLRALESRVDWPVVSEARELTDVIIAVSTRTAQQGAAMLEKGLATATDFIRSQTQSNVDPGEPTASGNPSSENPPPGNTPRNETERPTPPSR
jgi:serine/threonine protein kinase